MNTNLHFSSNDDTWSTPQGLYDNLNSVFKFTLDPACSEATAKCKKFYTEEDDGLSKSWEKEIVFLNPPYSRILQPKFIKKASEENATTIALIPSRTDTKLWQEIIFNKAIAICFIKGRLKFGSATDAAPFPSAIIIFGNNKMTINQQKLLKTYGKLIILKKNF